MRLGRRVRGIGRAPPANQSCLCDEFTVELEAILVEVCPRHPDAVVNFDGNDRVPADSTKAGTLSRLLVPLTCRADVQDGLCGAGYLP